MYNRHKPIPLKFASPVQDVLGRPLEALRISVTDRCNFRCAYCLPQYTAEPGQPFLPAASLLSFAEILRLAGLFVQLGVRKIRITGGEPLLRPDLPRMVAQLAVLPGLEELTLTTNGIYLGAQAAALKQAGLTRVTVSLDSLDTQVFQRMNGTRTTPDAVLAGIDAALAAGLHPVKINTVVMRGMNDQTLLPLAAYFKARGLTVRFIEYMDAGTRHGWSREQVVSAAEITAQLQQAFGLVALPAAGMGQVANLYRYADGQAQVGVIASITQPFCQGCNRARLGADGQLFNCLFAHQATPLGTWLKAGYTDDQLLAAMQSTWTTRSDRYSELRQLAPLASLPKVDMHRIGG